MIIDNFTMVDYPLISIIIPIYNSAKFLNRCIDSVLTQDYTNIEIILVDDGSKDDSPAICDEYAIANTNVTVLHIPNGGASLARKRGIEIAKGEYLSFIDSDDYVAKNYISALYAAVYKYHTQVASCHVQITTANDRIKTESSFFVSLLTENMLMHRFFYYEFWGMPGGLYKRDVLSNLYFPKETLCEDYFIKAQIFIRTTPIALVESPLYIYEKHEGSLSNTPLSLRAFDEFKNTYRVYEIIKQNKPQYAGLALKNVVETCIKLLLMDSLSKRLQYAIQYKPIYEFLKFEEYNIYNNKFLLKKQKFIALTLRYFPKISIIYNLILH